MLKVSRYCGRDGFQRQDFWGKSKAEQREVKYSCHRPVRTHHPLCSTYLYTPSRRADATSHEEELSSKDCDVADVAASLKPVWKDFGFPV